MILTPNASIATELVTLRATANPDADLDPDPRTDADGTLAPTLPVIAVEAAMTATIADALLTEDAEALLAVIATIVAMIAGMMTADKVAVATATRAAMNGATTKDVMVVVRSVDAHPSAVVPAHHLAAEAPLLEKMKEGDPDLVIPVSNYCQHFDEINGRILTHANMVLGFKERRGDDLDRARSPQKDNAERIQQDEREADNATANGGDNPERQERSPPRDEGDAKPVENNE